LRVWYSNGQKAKRRVLGVMCKEMGYSKEKKKQVTETSSLFKNTWQEQTKMLVLIITKAVVKHLDGSYLIVQINFGFFTS